MLESAVEMLQAVVVRALGAVQLVKVLPGEGFAVAAVGVCDSPERVRPGVEETECWFALPKDESREAVANLADHVSAASPTRVDVAPAILCQLKLRPFADDCAAAH